MCSDDAKGSGFNTSFAVISANALIGAKQGVASAQRIGVGVYTVIFTQNINSCGTAGNVRGMIPGYVTMRLKTGVQNTLVVNTTMKNGAAANLPFSVFVTCGPAVSAQAGGIVYGNSGNPYLGTHRPAGLTVKRLGSGDYCVELPGTNLGNLAVASGDIGASGISIVTARQANGGCNGPEFLAYAYSSGNWTASDSVVFHFVVP
jgi:hypothetical protein